MSQRERRRLFMIVRKISQCSSSLFLILISTLELFSADFASAIQSTHKIPIESSSPSKIQIPGNWTYYGASPLSFKKYAVIQHKKIRNFSVLYQQEQFQKNLSIQIKIHSSCRTAAKRLRAKYEFKSEEQICWIKQESGKNNIFLQAYLPDNRDSKSIVVLSSEMHQQTKLQLKESETEFRSLGRSLTSVGVKK